MFDDVIIELRSRIEGQYRTHSRIEGQYRMHSRIEGQYRTHSRIEGQYRTHSRIEGQYRMHSRIEGQYRMRSRIESQYRMRSRIESQYRTHSRIEGQYRMHLRIEGQYRTHSRIEGQYRTHSRIEGQYRTRSRIEGQYRTHSRIEGQYRMHSRHKRRTDIRAPPGTQLRRFCRCCCCSQSLRPYYVSTAMTHHVRPSLAVPSPETFVQSALPTLATSQRNCGYWSHALQVGQSGCFDQTHAPSSFRAPLGWWCVTTTLVQIRWNAPLSLNGLEAPNFRPIFLFPSPFLSVGSWMNHRPTCAQKQPTLNRGEGVVF